jgi:hypothetical protein
MPSKLPLGYSEYAEFEVRPGHRLSWGFSRLFSIPPDNCRKGISIRPVSPSHKSFSNLCSIIRSTFKFLCFWLCHLNPLCSFAYCMACGFHPLWLNIPNYNQRRLQVTTLTLKQFFLTQCYLVLLWFKYCPQHPDLDTLSLRLYTKTLVLQIIVRTARNVHECMSSCSFLAVDYLTVFWGPQTYINER